MFLLDKPYISDFLLKTIEDNQLPVMNSEYAETAVNGRNIRLLDPSEIVAQAESGAGFRILTISENSIAWITEYLGFSGLPDKINLFKDKLKFRKLTAKLHPDLAFRPIAFSDLDTLDAAALSYPFIIKPAVGFFSMGVHMVADASHWQRVKDAIRADVQRVKDLYPVEVMDASMFIIEQLIEGDEYAIDAYYDDEGRPVILNIFQHMFSSGEDVSDRVYLTSRAIIEENLPAFERYLEDLGALVNAKNFPVHVEIRQDSKGVIRPIEVNPLRFGGWCTTADMTWYSYGFNSYLAYFRQEKPDWKQILKNRTGITYAIVVLDNSTGFACENIKDFDFEKVESGFECVMHTRRVNYHEYPLFGFLFTKTTGDDLSELTTILTSSLKEFVTV